MPFEPESSGWLSARRMTRSVAVGPVLVGGGAPISVQSMCTTDTRDIAATLAQIRDLASAGCDIVRVAVVDTDAARALKPIVEQSPLPVVADLHFDPRLALLAVEARVAGLRINPATFGAPDDLRTLARAAADRHLPIRVGVNAGSLRRGTSGAQTLVETLAASALEGAALLEAAGVSQIKLSLKASDLATTVQANRLAAARCDYPIHLGVTEAGTLLPGAVRSAAALGILLAEGIGDTIRISLAAHPMEEVYAGRQLLAGLGLGRPGLTLVACPSCGRSTVDVHALAARVERALRGVRHALRVAIMGCAVNGPGEALAADIGLYGSAGSFVLVREGRVWGRVPAEAAERILLCEARKLLEERQFGKN